MEDPYKDIAHKRVRAGAPAAPAAGQAGVQPEPLPPGLPTVQERATGRTASQPASSAAPSALPAESMEATAFKRGPARRPALIIGDPLLQWATGLQTKDRRIYAGWLCEAGRHEELDAAMERAGFGQVTIKHGGGNFVTHWAIERAGLFVVCDGVQSIAEMRITQERHGIAFGWRYLTDGRLQSVLRARIFLHELLAIGYLEPLQLTLKSTLTGDMIAALLRQYEVLDQADAYRRQDGRPELRPPYYAVALPIGPGEPVQRGSSQSKEITPPIALLPSPISREYIRANWLRAPWAQRVESLVEPTVAWSRTESAAIAAGEDQQPQPGEY